MAVETLDPSKMVEFIQLVEDELLNNNWNEAYCIISTMIDTHIIPKTVNDIHFFVSLREIRESIARKPKIVEIQKCSKNLTIKMSKSLQEQDLRQKWNKDTSDVEKLNDEIDKLEDVLDEIAKLEDTLNEANEKSDIKVSLKNYVLFRLMSFFEFKILVSLKNAMDGGNNYQVTYGTEILQDGKGLVYNLDKMVILVLSDFMYKENRKFELNSDSSFMDFFDKIIEIKSEDLKNYFKANYDGSWFLLMKTLSDKRNEITHELQNAVFPIGELRNIQNLMQIFCYSFERILDSLMGQMGSTNDDPEFAKMLSESSDNMSKLNAEFVTSEKFSNLIKEIFEKKHGTVKWFDQEKGFGYIITENKKELFVHKNDMDGVISEGDKVTFSIGKNKQGPAAKQVKVA